MTFNREMLAALRKAGFKRQWVQRSKLNGDAVQYERWEPDRKIEVRLENGARFVTNALIINNDRRRLSWTTNTTPFNTVSEMLAAIEHERTRKDHKQ